MPSCLVISAMAIAILSGDLKAQRSEAPLQPDGRLLRLGTDSLAVFVVQGADTTETGLVVDELQAVDESGSPSLRRVYRSVDRLLGARIDSLVDRRQDLAPISHRSRTDRTSEFLTFGDGKVHGWLRLANGDSVGVQASVAHNVYNSSSFDLVLRAAPLREGWRATVPVFLPNTRTVVELNAHVAGTEVVDGEATWRVHAEFTGMPVVFWISQTSRALRRQTMQIRADLLILFAARKQAPRQSRTS